MWYESKFLSSNDTLKYHCTWFTSVKPFSMVNLCLSGITLRDDGVLTIERVKKDDEGLYVCEARNVAGMAKTSAVVTVHGKSFFTMWSQTARIPPDLTTVLTSNALTISLYPNQTSQRACRPCFHVTTTNSRGLTSVWKVSPDTKSVAARNAKWILSWVLWPGLWLRGWVSLHRGHDLCEVLRGPLMTAMRLTAWDWKREAHFWKWTSVLLVSVLCSKSLCANVRFCIRC